MKKYVRVIENNWMDAPICLFCGEPQNEKWDDHLNSYFECDCKDALLDREIEKQISELKSKRPLEKFYIDKVSVLVKIR